MSRFFTQTVFQGFSGLPEDQYVNTLAFESNSMAPTEGEVTTMIEAVQALFNGLEGIMSDEIAAGPLLKIYNIDNPEPRVPLVEAELDVSPSAGTVPLPAEVAICLSFRGGLVSGAPAGRRRGRIYVGPLGTAALGVGGRPDPTVVGVMEDAVEAFRAELDPEPINHAVWSRAGDNLYDVLEYWTDDAFDTQRRRGLAPSLKSVLYTES